MLIEKEIESYLNKSFGFQTEIHPANSRELAYLPLYLKGGYRFYFGQIASIRLLWAAPKEPYTPEQIKQHQQQLNRIFNCPVVFVFTILDSWVRQRLVQRQIGFLQIGKQLYIPQLFLELSDIAPRAQVQDKTNGKLSMPAQAAIIFELLKGGLQEKSFGHIANLLSYSPMTVTRLARELTSLTLTEITGTKEKQIRFLHQGKSLWESAKPYLSSPVKEEWFVDELIDDVKKWRWQAGDTALEHYTLLSAGSMPTYAIHQEKLAIVKRDLNVRFNKENGNYKIQSWSYDPGLSGTWPVADPLSIYLSVTKREDERVAAALEELLNSISW